MKRTPIALFAFAALAATLTTSTAQAEPTAWLSGGGGLAIQQRATTLDATGVAVANGASGTETRPAMSFALGVGTSPAARFVFGGLFRVTTFFQQGTDLFLGPRLATGGFARGDFGLAFDLGVAFRTYKDGIYGRVPLQAVALFGVPFGLQVGIGAQAFSLDGGSQTAGAFAMLEMDVLRLTVLRQGSSTRFWENPSPLGGKVKELSSRSKERDAVGPLRELVTSH